MMTKELKYIIHIQAEMESTIKAFRSSMECRNLSYIKNTTVRGNFTGNETIQLQCYIGIAIWQNRNISEPLISKTVWQIQFHKISNVANPQHIFIISLCIPKLWCQKSLFHYHFFNIVFSPTCTERKTLSRKITNYYNFF